MREVEKPSYLTDGSSLRKLSCVVVSLSMVICAEPAKQRQAIAKSSGADAILDPTKQDVVEECKKLTGVSGG